MYLLFAPRLTPFLSSLHSLLLSSLLVSLISGKTPTHNYTPHRVVPHPHASSYYVIHILPLTVLILVFLSLSLLLLCNCTTVGKMVRVMWKAREKRRRKR